MTSQLLGLLLFSWTLQLGGGQSVTHTGPPIVVSLANKSISFGCKITYLYTAEYKSFTVSYFYIDGQGKSSTTKHVNCQPSQGTENQTHTVECQVTPLLQDVSATGTYYCSVHWPHTTKNGSGTFILVRDSGYREPPRGFQDAMLFGFTSLLTVLSVLGTALLFWKKKQMQVPGKQRARKCQDPRSASSPKKPLSDSIYTDLQRRDTEVYACIESEANNLPFSRSPLSQAGLHRSEDEGEFGLVYENL
ncbi:NFAT activation molecule 1 [Dugong dugon]